VEVDGFIAAASPPEEAMKPRILLVVLPFALGCHLGRGTEPHDMGAAEHDQQAERESAQAQQHSIARTIHTADASAKGDNARTAADCGASTDICWNYETGDDHERIAEHHRRIAARHRAASVALRAAETKACADIGADDRATSPLAHRRDIRSVRTLEESADGDYNSPAVSRPVGAEIVFRAVPGMTAEWLQHQVDCHLARNAAIGHTRASADMPYCPLTLVGVRAIVSSTGDGFAVAVKSDDAATANEIVRRSQALVD
jgi:hypothetical protein